MQADESQQQATHRALNGDRLSVITGGAGTGKTTTISAIMRAQSGAVLLAPTGKAAARLREEGGACEEARTIHSYLQFDGERFQRGGQITRPIIIDEASMIDSALMASILRYNPPKITLVGDSAQLPPVGRGQPFHDIIRLRPDLVSTLTTCYRSTGAVCVAGNEIRAGRAPAKVSDSGGEKWSMVATGSQEATLAKLTGWLQVDGFFDPEQDIILAPQYGSDEGTDAGINSLNALAKSIFNPRAEWDTDDKFNVKDRVICTQNNAKEDLWNGDLGTVMNTDYGQTQVMLDRDDKSGEYRTIGKAALRSFKLAYALSVHKAQGSQFRRVIFVVAKGHSRMLTRSLIYTAVTRARKGCCVVGELSAFYSGINNIDNRRTVLQYLAETN